MECLEKDLDEGLTYLLFPVEHRKRIRTTNLLERTFGETRRRTKVIPRFPGERACLSLLFATLITAAEKWRGIRMTPQILRALDALRTEEAWEKDQSAACHGTLRLDIFTPKLGLDRLKSRRSTCALAPCTMATLRVPFPPS